MGILEVAMLAMMGHMVHRRRSHILRRGTCPSSFESEGAQKGPKV